MLEINQYDFNQRIDECREAQRELKRRFPLFSIIIGDFYTRRIQHYREQINLGVKSGIKSESAVRADECDQLAAGAMVAGFTQEAQNLQQRAKDHRACKIKPSYI